MTRPSWQDFGTHDESAYPELWDGVVGAWCPSLGPTGLRLHDHSRRNNWGTLANMDAATDWVVDGGQYALDMDGTNDFVQLPATTASTQQTVAIHVSMRTTGIIVGGGNDTYALYVDSLNANGSIYYNSGGFVNVVHGGLSSQWAHLAVVRNGVSVTFFKNGIQIGNTQTLATNTAQSLQYIAREGRGFYSSMLWDDCSIYNRPLSANEIRQMYQLGRGGMYERKRRTLRRVGVEQLTFRSSFAQRSALIGSGVY